jgi:hypothetical protein
MGDMADWTLESMDDFGDDDDTEREPCTVGFSLLVHQTDKAWLIDFGKPSDKQGVASKWVPKSQCTMDTTECTIEMPYWLMAEKGLEDYVED